MSTTDSVNSVLSLSVPSVAVDVPANLQTYFQPVYSSFFTILDGLVNYCGMGTLGAALGESMSIEDQCFPQGMTKVWMQAGAAISSGMLVAFKQDTVISTDQAVCVPADCTNSLPACGVYHGTTALSAGEWGEFWLLRAMVTYITGLTPGKWYYLATGGLITATPVTTAGYISQFIGFAIKADVLLLDIASPKMNTVGNTSNTFLRST